MAAIGSLVRSFISVQKLLHCRAIPPSQSTIIGGNNGVRQFSTVMTESAIKRELKKEMRALKAEVPNWLELDKKNFVGKLERLTKSVDWKNPKELDSALVMRLMKEMQNDLDQQKEKWAQACKSLESVPNLLNINIPQGIENLESSKGYCNDELQKIEPKIRRIQQKIEDRMNFWLLFSKVWENLSLAVALTSNAVEQKKMGAEAPKLGWSSVSKDLGELHDDLQKLAAKYALTSNAVEQEKMGAEAPKLGWSSVSKDLGELHDDLQKLAANHEELKP